MIHEGKEHYGTVGKDFFQENCFRLFWYIIQAINLNKTS